MIRYILWLIPVIMVACTGDPAEKTVATPELWGSLAPGPFGVGYTVVEHIDSTRTVRNTNNERPIQVTIWYPTSSSLETDRSRYRDYYSLTISQTNFQTPTESEINTAVEQFISFLGSNGIPDTAGREWLSSPMAGVQDADPAGGIFPLVVVAQGNFHSAYNQAVLSEYLASHGYIVATTPSVSLKDGPMGEDDSIFDYADSQAQDLEAAIEAAKEYFGSEFEQIALVGHSFGARAAFLLPMRRHIDAFVSQDGGIANRHGKEWLDGVEFDYSNWNTPLLHLYQEGDSIVVPNFELIDSLIAIEPMVVRVDSIPHMGFTSLGFVAGAVPGFTIGTKTDDIGSRASEIVEATRLFLDTTLKGEKPKQNWLTGNRWRYLHPRTGQQ